MTDMPRNKAERLAVAGAIAASVRVTGERDQARRVALIDEDGNVVGYTTVAEVKRSMLERAKIELAVVDGKRPKTVVCEQCGLPTPVTTRAKNASSVPRFCRVCLQGRCSRCGGLRKTRDRKRSDNGLCFPCLREKRAELSVPCGGCGKPLSRSARCSLRKGQASGLCKPCVNRARPKKTHCKWGHPRTGENVYRTPGGKMECVPCRVEAQRRARARKAK
jgi:hypothetical protein